MAEGFSFAVNIITVVDVASKLIAFGNTFVQSSRGQHKEVQLFVREVSTLSGVLSSLSATIQGHDATTRRASLIAGPLEECRKQLSDLHQSLVKQVSGRTRWIRMGRALKWPMKERETREWIERIERHKNSFALALHLDEREIAGDIRAELADIKKSQEEERKAAQESRKRAKYREAISWLSPASQHDTHITTRKLRHTDTGTWFLEGDAYKDWKAQDGGFLWLHGNAGSGKTILSSTIIDDITKNSATHLAYYYFDRTRTESNNPAYLYGSLIAQILESHFTDLPLSIESHFDKNRQHRPLETDLYGLLTDLLTKVPGYTFIIDGIDICPNREMLLQTIPGLKARVLVTSVDEPDIFDELENLPKTELARSLVEGDFATFVRAETERHPALKKLKPRTKTEIFDVIVHRAETFRWVREALDAVSKRRSDRDIRAVLKKLKGDDDGNDSGIEDNDGDFD